MSNKPKKLHAPRYALYWGEIVVAIIRDVTPFLETKKTREAWAVEHCLPTLKDGKKYKPDFHIRNPNMEVWFKEKNHGLFSAITEPLSREYMKTLARILPERTLQGFYEQDGK